jgi:hypothetical protein
MEDLHMQATSSSTKQNLAALSELAGVLQALQKNYNRRMVLENFFVGLSAHDASPRDLRRHV